MSNDLKYRYPGAYSFSTEQKALFFGRKTPIKELYQLVRLEQLIVLYGKSGLGKTSLINAGILPLVLEEGSYEPISIRFNAWTKGKKDTPSDIVRAEILKNIPTNASFLPNVMPDDGSFWYAVKTRLLSQAEPKQPLFIFDQFEELFTYPDDSVRVFAQWFSELLLNDLPQRVRRMRDLYLQIEPDGLTEDQLRRLNESPIPKALVSIRSDRMSLLDKLTGHVPHILDTRYELQPLDDTEAEEAIVKPADTEGVFASKEKFTYAHAALTAITDYLTNQKRQRVESFQLQIVCQSVEQTVIKQRLKTVQAQDLGDLEKIFENYYEDSILGLDTEGGNTQVQAIARRLIEDKLVLEKEQRRLSRYEGELLDVQGVDENLLVQLVNSRLLRREISRLGNGFDYELSHDTLVAPVLKARKERIEKEQALQTEQKRLADEQEAKRKLAEAERQAEIEKQRAEEAEKLRYEADIQKTKAIEHKQEAENQRQIAIQEREKAELQTLLAKKQKKKATIFAIISSVAFILALLALVTTFLLFEKQQKAQEDAQKAKLSIVTGLLQDIDDNIKKLDYNNALLTSQRALDIGVNTDSTKLKVLEIAYWYTETDTIEAAIKALKMLSITTSPNRIDLLKTIDNNISRKDSIIWRERYYPKIIPVQGDTFTMGSKGNPNELPLHKVKLSSFGMAETETTVWQYFLYLKANRLPEPKKPVWEYFGNHPVVYVNWNDAKEYLDWLSKRLHKKYRLPTEAEWEFAARGGKVERNRSIIYSGSNILDSVSWYFSNSKSQTHAVKELKANALGLYDMSGNVWEWCYDWFDEKYYEKCAANGISVNPRGSETGLVRSLRGGSWDNEDFNHSVSFRYRYYLNKRINSYGFRALEEK